MSQELERKELAVLEIKDEAQGLVEAIFATLNVVDKDEDVILPEAIVEGQKAKLSEYGHSSITTDEPPVGVGTIGVMKDKAVFSGKYFLTTTRGREAFETIKAMGKDQEWSFGFQVKGSEVPDDDWKKKGARRIITKLNIFEVSPVLIGAGVGTRTLAAKAADDAARLKAEEEARVAAEAEAQREARAQQVRVKAAMDEYHRTQRAFKRMGIA